jgi:GPH family glycoside/pentoside/hexuronide:cation symporter
MKDRAGVSGVPQRISTLTKNCFGIADFGVSAVFSAMQFYMLFYYTDVVKIDPGIAGTAMLVGKLTWDLANDVLCGYITDRTRSRWGRRRPFLIFCALPLGASFWLLFSLPVGMSNVVAFFAVIGSFLLYDTFMTMVSTAYYAMTAELTLDYNERTSLTSVRMVYNSVGYIFGAAITTVIAALLRDSLGFSDRLSWSMVGLGFGVLCMIAVLVTGLTVTMKPAVEPEPTSLTPIRAILATLKNKYFLLYAAIQSLVSIAFTFITTMLPYFVKYQLLMESRQSIIMIALLVTLTIFLIPCRTLANRVGKNRTYAIGLSLASAAMVVCFFMPNRATNLMFAVAVVAGIGFSSQWICPHSMIPDVIEFAELETGERREGVYYGLNAMISKITNALSIMLCGWGLKFFGYVEGQAQSATSLLGIRLMFSLLPVVILLISVPMLVKYPITRESHARVVEELARRRAAQ